MMARPKKQPHDRRDRKVIVWVSRQEQARFLVNATRNGLTGPDYLRAVACGVAGAANDATAMVLPLDAGEQSALLARAGAAGQSPQQYVLDLAFRSNDGTGQIAGFELVDTLVRIGTTLQQLQAIAARTGYFPDEIAGAMARLERALDRLLPP
jgi:hypothetical protein